MSQTLISAWTYCTTMASASKAQSVQDLFVVDCDVHVTETEEDLVPYLEDPWHSMLNNEHVSNTTPGAGNHYPPAGFLTPMDTGKIQDDTLATQAEIEEFMEMMSVDRTLTTPGVNLLLSCMHNKDLASAFGRAFNEYFLDNILDREKGIYGTAVINPHQPEKAAEEIHDRGDEKEIVGVMLPIGGVKGYGPLLGDEKYHPIYEAAEANDLPIVMHNSASAAPQSFPDDYRGSSTLLTVHVGHHPADFLFHLSSILTKGVPERYPDLNFVVQESGIGWVPYWMRRYDDEYSEKREDAPVLQKKPSEYIREQFYFTSQPIEGQDDPEYVAQMIRLFGGEENLMFASDYPHMDFDHTQKVFDLLRGHFEEAEIANMFGETARRVFDFPA